MQGESQSEIWFKLLEHAQRLGTSVGGLRVSTQREIHEDAKRNPVGPTVDLLVSSWVPVLFSSTMAAVLSALISESEERLQDVRENLTSREAITAVGSLLTFLVVTRTDRNLQINRNSIEIFASYCNTCVALANFAFTMVPPQSFCMKPVRVRRGKGQQYSELVSTRFLMLVVTLPVLLRNRFSGVKNSVHALPLGNVLEDTSMPTSLQYQYRRHISTRRVYFCEQPARTTDGQPARTTDCQTQKKFEDVDGMTDTFAVYFMLNRYITQLKQDGTLQAPEATYLMGMVNSLVENESKMSILVLYRLPRALSLLLYAVFFVYFGLLIVTELVVNNGYNSVWISALVSFSTLAVLNVSERTKNPFKSRAGAQAQRSLLWSMSLECMLNIDAIYEEEQEPPLLSTGGLRTVTKGVGKADRFFDTFRREQPFAAEGCGFSMRLDGAYRALPRSEPER